VGHLLGVPFTPDTIRELLEPLGFAVAKGSGPIDVEVPGFRSYDVTREVDLIEEIARVHGYDRFPEEPRPFRPGTVPDHPLFGLEDRIRDELTSWGFFEAQTPAFAPVGEGEVELLNPISTEERFLRNRLLPGLLRRLEHNAARGNRDVRLFELGTAFGRSEAGALPLESVHLVLVMHGLRTAPHWSGGADRLDVWDLKGVLDRVTGVLSADGWTLSSDRPAAEATVPLEPWASLYVTDREGQFVGAGGRLAARDLDLPPWAQDVWVAELVLPANPVPTPPSTYVALPVHPGVERDLALLLPGGVRVEDALGTARAHGGGHLTGIGVFDVYRDESMPAGHRSVAVRLRFQAPDRTLTDPEVGEAVQRIVKALQEELSVGIRGQADGRDRP
jgi:phenylalanyl-tRNA synthetase beta chain